MHTPHSKHGSVLVYTLAVVALLTLISANGFLRLTSNYRTTHHSAAWQEALTTAEAGVDMALASIRSSLRDADTAWSEWESADDEALTKDPTTGTMTLTSQLIMRRGEGGTRSYAQVTLEAPPYLIDRHGEQWFLVRSLGVTELPGSPQQAESSADSRLRKLSLINDHRTGEKVDYPQVSRLVEVIIKPVGAFQNALTSATDIRLNNHNPVVDSYDSRYPGEKSDANGKYHIDFRQENGHIAANRGGIDVGNAHIYGDVKVGDEGTITNTANVTGNLEYDFYQELLSVTAPVVAPDAGTPTTITSDTEIYGSKGEPTQVMVDTIKLSGNNLLTFKSDPGGTPTYVEVLVNGDVSLSGNAQIVVEDNVFVRMFVKGNGDISGNGLMNSNTPLHFQLYGVKPDSGTRSFTITGNGGFHGAVYAPDATVEIKGGGSGDSVYGSFVGRYVFMNGSTAVHYDEALGEGGLISDYRVASWVEDSFD